MISNRDGCEVLRNGRERRGEEREKEQGGGGGGGGGGWGSLNKAKATRSLSHPIKTHDDSSHSAHSGRKSMNL
jgi:hypothetical protein